ncbi:hypothetical protein K7432_014739 [Basidiobolus ranarum]|uniref:Dilute domain-containing protein n=1 Tax=Basidiobolus ranarum TaxID=34480 RepID=A0ABR2VPX2_9FUNG
MVDDIGDAYDKKNIPAELKIVHLPDSDLVTPSYTPEPEISSYCTSSTGPKTPDSDIKLKPWNYCENQNEVVGNRSLEMDKELGKLSISIKPINEHYKIDNLLLPTSPTSPTHALVTDHFEAEEEILTQSYFTQEQKTEKLTRFLRRAASNGDSKRVKKLLDVAKDYIDIDGRDEDGTTPLIYAACWGYLEVAYSLLEAGANPNAQDKSGWTALMWATNNHHDGIVATLIDHGASTSSKSSKGRTVMDFANHALDNEKFENQRILEILTDPRDGHNSFGSNRESGYYTYSRADIESVISESDILYKMALDQAKGNDADLTDFRFSEYSYFDDEVEFNWEDIQPDQMFVYTYENLDLLLEKIITNMRPLHSRECKFISANALFLAARYGVHLAGPDLLEALLSQSFKRIVDVVKQNRQDMSLLAFWLSNCTLLLYYLKKDAKLVTATVDYQLSLSELIHDLYQHFVRNATQRIEEVLEPAMLGYDPLPGMEDIKFVGEKRNFLFTGKKIFTPPPSPRTSRFSIRRKNRTSTSGTSTRVKPATPKTVCCILSSTLIVLKSYEVHPTIIHYALNQIFHYISAELFNQVLTTKDNCCRAKGMQIRMNLSTIEDWVHHNRLPQVLLQHFQPLIQIFQLLHCVSGLADLTELLMTIKELSSLNSLQIYRVANNYRYEVGERVIPEEITQYLAQVVKDTCSLHTRTSVEIDREGRRTPKVREEEIDTLPNQESGQNARSDDMEELMDPTHLLPFAIPTSAEMVNGWGKSEKDYILE